MAKVRRREPLSPGAPVPVELLSVPSEGIIVVRFLDAPTGLLAHWGKKNAIACPGPEDCETKVHRGRTTWKGYAPVEFYRQAPYDDWAPAVLEVTERLQELLQGHELRGEVWKLERQKGRYGYREVCGEVAGECNADYLRPPFPIEPVVYRIYGTTRILFGVEPLLPPRMLLPAGAGACPAGLMPSTSAPPPRPISIKERARQLQETGQLPSGASPALTGSLPPAIAARIGGEGQASGNGAGEPSTPGAVTRPTPPSSSTDNQASATVLNPALQPSRNGKSH